MVLKLKTSLSSSDLPASLGRVPCSVLSSDRVPCSVFRFAFGSCSLFCVLFRLPFCLWCPCFVFRFAFGSGNKARLWPLVALGMLRSSKLELRGKIQRHVCVQFDVLLTPACSSPAHVRPALAYGGSSTRRLSQTWRAWEATCGKPSCYISSGASLVKRSASCKSSVRGRETSQAC
jgi:hypothetical protein